MSSFTLKMTFNNCCDILGIKIASINVNGIINNDKKRNNLHQWLVRNNIDIALLQECCIHHENVNAKFPIADFSGYLHNANQKNLESKIIWKRNLAVSKPKIGKRIYYKKGQWCEWISLINEKQVLHIASFYHSPSNEYINTKYDCISKDIFKLDNLYPNLKSYFVISGDINAETLIWGNKLNEHGENLLE